MVNALGELFNEIASAIIEKTGEEGKMKPAEFAERIRSIVVSSGGDSNGGSGGGDDSGSSVSTLKIKMGTFSVDANGSPAEVAHGLGQMPDFVFVQNIGFYTGAMEDYIDARWLMFSWTIKSDFGTDWTRGSMIPGIGLNEKTEITTTSTISVYCPNEEVFRFGAASGNGKLQPNGSYRWMAISGLGNATPSKDLCYVTFMNHDGTVELGRKAVATGDDCADPISRGVFTTPVRESSPQYNYTFAGWATTANGGLNSNALKAVTEDRTVYANFASVTRYYTVTFYDSDGTTVLATKSYTYNAVPDYTPTKVGSTFDGWTTEIVPVTEDASYVAKWIDKMNFASLTWSQISDYSKSGEAAALFELGATKTFTTASGATVTARIIGFNHDDLSDGTGKAGITMEVDTPSSIAKMAGGNHGWADAGNNTYAKNYWWENSFRTWWNDKTTTGRLLTTDLPSDLVKVIRQVKKKSYFPIDGVMGYTDDYLWLPSNKELGFAVSGSTWDEGECYAIYTPGKQNLTAYPELVKPNAGTAKYTTRTKESASQVGAIDSSGMKTTFTFGTSDVKAFLCFCI